MAIDFSSEEIELWKKTNIRDMRRHEQAKRAEAESKKQMLRGLIGDKYKILLDSTDDIARMLDACKSLQEMVLGLDFKQESVEKLEETVIGHGIWWIRAQMSRFWELLDDGEFIDAYQLYLTIKNYDEFVLEHLTIADYPNQLRAFAKSAVKRGNTDTLRKALAVLTCIASKNRCAHLKPILESFLSNRSDLPLTIHKSASDTVRSVIQTIQHTLCIAVYLFATESVSDGLLSNLQSELGVTFENVSKDELERMLTVWIHNARTRTAKVLEESFASVDDINLLGEIRDVALQVLSEPFHGKTWSQWSIYAFKGGLNLWDTILHPVFVQSLEKTLESIFKSIQSRVLESLDMPSEPKKLQWGTISCPSALPLFDGFYKEFDKASRDTRVLLDFDDHNGNFANLYGYIHDSLRDNIAKHSKQCLSILRQDIERKVSKVDPLTDQLAVSLRIGHFALLLSRNHSNFKAIVMKSYSQWCIPVESQIVSDYAASITLWVRTCEEAALRQCWSQSGGDGSVIAPSMPTWQTMKLLHQLNSAVSALSHIEIDCELFNDAFEVVVRALCKAIERAVEELCIEKGQCVLFQLWFDVALILHCLGRKLSTSTMLSSIQKCIDPVCFADQRDVVLKNVKLFSERCGLMLCFLQQTFIPDFTIQPSIGGSDDYVSALALAAPIPRIARLPVSLYPSIRSAHSDLLGDEKTEMYDIDNSTIRMGEGNEPSSWLSQVGGIRSMFFN